MSSWNAQTRIEAAHKRDERAARKRQKDLEKILKERAKLSALEQAKLEVEAYENALDLLLSVHKERSTPFDWDSIACALPPHQPPRIPRQEFSAQLRNASSWESDTDAEVQARCLDENEYHAAQERHHGNVTEWERMGALARRVLAGESGAYSQAVSEFSTLAEISSLGSSIHVTVHGPKLIECALKVNGSDVIPKEAKSLTAFGKLSVKAMPKARFHEIYQDYVSSCVLRLARELMALLPVEIVLVTATVDGTDSRTGHTVELPVLSVALPRTELERLDFDRLDPSDSIENFLHRGDVKASRKSGEFVSIVPLAPDELTPAQPERMDFATLLVRIRQARAELRIG